MLTTKPKKLLLYIYIYIYIYIYKRERERGSFNGPSNSNFSRNDKSIYVGYSQGPFKKDIIIIKVVLLVKYKDIKLVYLTMSRKFNNN